ncbi:hypothetical protein KXQ82_07320 [Mucilaginibacter sp. HMF5004]|uniref:hypothetical protein n=1 Tax=Mucilaginibacter rivuli TaxID=2857527 RepID=UPI001C5DAC58|nr:hypothetical protein [Mucilaginibacter rivuli]MBW4889518.1 hypothetical protein [Mucilaginibacter rivuli]
MVRTEYYQASKYLTDLKEFEDSESAIGMVGNAKNIDRLKDLNIQKLWLLGANEKELDKILKYCKPEFISIYQVLAQDLTILESLTTTKTIVLIWNSKIAELWNLNANTNLSSLTIKGFSKLNNIDPIGKVENLEYLVLEGGMWKPLKIKSISSLANLTNLKYLRLANLKIEDGSLRPIGNLQNLEKLSVSNQFNTEEYAWLSVKLKNTTCNLFQPYIKLNQKISDNDIMVVGRRKPFLNSEKDKDKIQKYEQEFYRLVKASE